jgi:hypothetical protein
MQPAKHRSLRIRPLFAPPPAPAATRATTATAAARFVDVGACPRMCMCMYMYMYVYVDVYVDVCICSLMRVLACQCVFVGVGAGLAPFRGHRDFVDPFLDASGPFLPGLGAPARVLVMLLPRRRPGPFRFLGVLVPFTAAVLLFPFRRCSAGAHRRLVALSLRPLCCFARVSPLFLPCLIVSLSHCPILSLPFPRVLLLFL